MRRHAGGLRSILGDCLLDFGESNHQFHAASCTWERHYGGLAGAQQEALLRLRHPWRLAMNPTLSRLRSAREEQTSFVQELLDKAEAEERSLSEAELGLVEQAKRSVEELDEQITPLVAYEETRSQGDALDARIGSLARPAARTEPRPTEGGSLGDMFADSDALSNYSWRGASAAFNADLNLDQVRAPALLTTTTSPGKDFLPATQKLMLGGPNAVFNLYDAVSKIPVNSNAVDMVVYGDPKGAKTPTVVAEGTAKPEVELVSKVQTFTLETIAGYVQATRQLLQSAPAIRSFIDQQLVRGILAKIETEIQAAITAATITTTTGASGQSMIEVARAGMAAVEAAGYRPNALLANPADLAGFDLEVYKLGFQGPVPGISTWGLNAIPVPGLAAGTVYVGDFSTAVSWLYKTGVEIFISDSHADTFIKNIFTILGEVMGKAVVAQPGALTKLKVTP